MTRQIGREEIRDEHGKMTRQIGREEIRDEQRTNAGQGHGCGMGRRR